MEGSALRPRQGPAGRGPGGSSACRGEHRPAHDEDRRILLRAAPIAATAVAVVWFAALGFRLHWWRTGNLDHDWDALSGGPGVPGAEAVARGLAAFGTGLPAVLVVGALAVVVGLRRGPLWAGATAAVPWLDSLQVGAAKSLAARMRPDGADGLANAFPSGHTALAAVLAALVAVLLLRGRARLLVVPYPIAMGWSRTWLHAHWLSDVLAGAVLGGATALLLLLAVDELRRRAHSAIEHRPGRTPPRASEDPARSGRWHFW